VATIAAELRRTARSVPVAQSAVAASVGLPAEVPTQPVHAAVVPAPTMAATPGVDAGPGERARLRRVRRRRQRVRRTTALVGAAAVMVALTIPVGLWAMAGHSAEPPLVATVPDDVMPDVSGSDAADSPGHDAVPASTSTVTSGSAGAEKPAPKAKAAPEPDKKAGPGETHKPAKQDKKSGKKSGKKSPRDR
jgi:hypothetical protein